MSEHEHIEERAEDAVFEEVNEDYPAPAEHLRMEDLRRVRLSLTFDLGNCPMQVRDVLELKRGSVVQLNKLAGEMTDIYVNGAPLARGEVVVIADGLHVRIGEMIGMEKDENAETDG